MQAFNGLHVRRMILTRAHISSVQMELFQISRREVELYVQLQRPRKMLDLQCMLSVEMGCVILYFENCSMKII